MLSVTSLQVKLQLSKLKKKKGMAQKTVGQTFSLILGELMNRPFPFPKSKIQLTFYQKKKSNNNDLLFYETLAILYF